MRELRWAALGVVVAVAAFCAVPAVSATFPAGCSASAKSVFKSCKEGVRADYWLAIGKCQNLANQGDRRRCTQDAIEAQVEAGEECGDQYEARLNVCRDLGEAPYEPRIRPTDFVSVIDNPFLPFVPGTTWIYEGETEDGMERVVVEATRDTREILGVPCTVVRDRVYLDGALVEDTLDYFAQDSQGNVWYFGELSYELEDGVIVNLEGSWEAGLDGAHPGIVMPANPAVGDLYRQEFLLGEAEDIGEIVSLDEAVTVPFGSFTGCRQTSDTLPISPDELEYKYYASGVGLLLEVNPEDGSRIELISMTR